MSLPPPGGPFPPPPPPGAPGPGFPGAGQPQWQPGPQQPWPPGPFPPPSPSAPTSRGRARKWVLGGIALLAVIAVTAAITVVVSRGSGDGASTPPAETYGLASADDKGPVTLITEDPTCAPWDPIRETLAQSQRQGWTERDIKIPATEWSPELRAEYERVANASTAAADQLVALAKATPHRVMRELYELFIAYARAYAASIPTYTAKDNHLATVMTSASGVITYICRAAYTGVASSRAPSIPAVEPPAEVAPLTDPSDPPLLMTSPDPTCSQWEPLASTIHPELKAWAGIDRKIPATDWTPEQRDIIEQSIPVFQRYADETEKIGQQSPNPIVQDLTVLSTQYRRAYAAALPTYQYVDNNFDLVAERTLAIVYKSCQFAES